MNAVAKVSGGKKPSDVNNEAESDRVKMRLKKSHVLIKTNIYLVCDTVSTLVIRTAAGWLLSISCSAPFTKIKCILHRNDTDETGS